MPGSLSPNAHAVPPDKHSGQVITRQRPELLPDCGEPTGPGSNGLRRVMQCALGIPYYGGNRVRRLLNGDQAIPAIYDAIDAAEHSIDMAQFVLWKSAAADGLLDRLRAAGERGVRVRLLLDGFGSYPFKDRDIRDRIGGSATVQRFRPLRLRRGFRNLNRSHRRMLVVDHAVAFTGGIGFGEEWFPQDDDQATPWRDSHFELRGPGIDGFYGAFSEHWAEALDRPVAGLNRMPAPEPAGDAEVQIIRADTSMKWSDVATAFRTLLQHAGSRFWLTTAYFTIDTSTARLLRDAAHRGVDVRVLIPGRHVDKWVEWFSMQESLALLEDAPIRAYRYQPAMLHAKTLVVDDDIAAFGSANFNFRSFRQDDEILVNCVDPALNRTLAEDFRNDLEAAEEVPLPYTAPRGLRARLGRFASRHARPHL